MSNFFYDFSKNNEPNPSIKAELIHKYLGAISFNSVECIERTGNTLVISGRVTSWSNSVKRTFKVSEVKCLNIYQENFLFVFLGTLAEKRDMLILQQYFS